MNIVEESMEEAAGYLLEPRNETAEEVQILRAENFYLKNRVYKLKKTN